MKISALAFGAAALLGICSLGFGQDTASAETLRVYLDVDRTLLPADVTDKAVIKIGLKRSQVAYATRVSGAFSLATGSRDAAVVLRLNPGTVLPKIRAGNTCTTKARRLDFAR